MDIRDTGHWNRFAKERLEGAKSQRTIAAIYAGATVGLSALVTVITYCLDLAIANTTGLSSLGQRSVLSTLQTMLPIGQWLLLLCLDLGYLAGMLRIARGQYASSHTLRLGFDRFWVLVRSWLLRGLTYLAVAIPAVYFAAMLYVLTPLADPLSEVMLSLMSQDQVTLDEAALETLMSAMTPCLIFCGVVVAAVCLVLSYRFRMVDYVVIDHPGKGARFALKESRKMMKGNCWRMVRLDLKLWWYYVALALAAGLSYLDLLLTAVGLPLPLGAEGTAYVCYGLSLAATFGVYYFLRNRVEVIFAFAYDAIKPEDQQEGVVLGNIFQM